MVSIHEDWGTIHFICFAENGLDTIDAELGREGNPLRLMNPKIPRIEFHKRTHSAEQLKELLNRLDTYEPKTLHFLSHGSKASPGNLFYNQKNFVPIDFNLIHKKLTILSLVSVCYQQDFNIQGYMHLFTSGNFVPKFGVDSINHALEHLYTKSFEKLDIPKFQRGQSYSFKY